MTEHMTEQYFKLLVTTLWKGGYPHEIISFLLYKLHQDDPGHGSIWSPKRIVRDLSHLKLIQLCDIIEQEYPLPKDLAESIFYIIRNRMLNKLEDIIKPRDTSAKKRLQPILKLPVSVTRLKDYFQKIPDANISDWSYKVQKNVREVMTSEGWIERSYEELLFAVISGN